METKSSIVEQQQLQTPETHTTLTHRLQGVLTFLYGLERVVGLDEFDGVRDLLTLQDVVAQTEVGHGELEHLIVPHRVLLKDGA